LRVYTRPIVGQPTSGQRHLNRRRKLETLKRLFPERSDEFDTRISEIDMLMLSMSFCRQCGRTIKNPDTAKEGYGPECLRKSLLESADMQGQERTP